MKKYLLTDFNTEKWDSIDMNGILEQVSKLNEGVLLGEVFHPDRWEISLARASHSIQNLLFEDGRIYGDVIFLDTEMGKLAKGLVDNFYCVLEMRFKEVARRWAPSKNEIRIISWDVVSPTKAEIRAMKINELLSHI